MSQTWERLSGQTAPRGIVWEHFHENSKTSPHDDFPSVEAVVARMLRLHETLPYPLHPVVSLPEPRALDEPLDDVLRRRASALGLHQGRLGLDELSTILAAAYGPTRDNVGTPFPRPFRTVPSAGALYPLELYLHLPADTEACSGILHFDPVAHELQVLDPGDRTSDLANALVQPEVAYAAAAVLVISVVFERTTFKYGDRGYRFALLEAGHVAQNVDLVCTALGVDCMNLGGFFDRRVDKLFGWDGITQSAVYLIAFGGSTDANVDGG